MSGSGIFCEDIRQNCGSTLVELVQSLPGSTARAFTAPWSLPSASDDPSRRIRTSISRQEIAEPGLAAAVSSTAKYLHENVLQYVKENQSAAQKTVKAAPTEKTDCCRPHRSGAGIQPSDSTDPGRCN
jgi:hypothetical protein